MGTYVISNTVTVAAGIKVNNFDCDPQSQGSIACSSKTDSNGVNLLSDSGRQRVLVSGNEAGSLPGSSFGKEPAHITAEERNPLDLLKNGDKVLFRVETHRRLNGIETDIKIPFSDNPNKKAEFVGTFTPAVIPGQSKARSNVRCARPKLSRNLKK